MKIFKIQHTYIVGFIIMFLMALLIPILIFGLIYSNIDFRFNKPTFMLIYVSGVLIMYKFLKKYTVYSLELVLENDKISFYRKNIMFNKNMIYTIPFDEINYFLYKENLFFNKFSIQYNNKRIQLLMYNDFKTNEAFLKFYKKFKSKVKKELRLKEKNNLHETRLGFYISVFLFITLLIIPILHVVYNTPINLGLLILLYGSCIYFIYKVYSVRKK